MKEGFRFDAHLNFHTACVYYRVMECLVPALKSQVHPVRSILLYLLLILDNFQRFILCLNLYVIIFSYFSVLFSSIFFSSFLSILFSLLKNISCFVLFLLNNLASLLLYYVLSCAIFFFFSPPVLFISLWRNFIINFLFFSFLFFSFLFILSNLILSYLISSHLILSYLFLSYLIYSYPIISFLFSSFFLPFVASSICSW